MLTTLSTAQRASIDRMNRDFATQSPGYTGGFSQLMADLLYTLSQGNTGIASLAADVDSLALGGGAFTIDTGTTSGLTFAHLGGRINLGASVLTAAAASVTLSASSTNYVEVDSAGTTHTNTGGFTAGRCPLYVIVTGGSAITTATSAKALLNCLAAIAGSQLSATAASKSIDKDIGSPSATATFTVTAPCAAALKAAVLTTNGAVGTSDTNYWSVSIVNKGQANAGTQQMLNVAGANTTKVTGGSAIAAGTARSLTLTTLSVGNELNVAANDTLLIAFTATGAPTALSAASLRLDFGFTG